MAQPPAWLRHQAVEASALAMVSMTWKKVTGSVSIPSVERGNNRRNNCASCSLSSRAGGNRRVLRCRWKQPRCRRGGPRPGRSPPGRPQDRQGLRSERSRPGLPYSGDHGVSPGRLFIVGGALRLRSHLRVRLTCRRSERQAHAGAEHACAESILMSCYPARCAPKRIAGAWEIWWTILPAGFSGYSSRALRCTRPTCLRFCR